VQKVVFSGPIPKPAAALLARSYHIVNAWDETALCAALADAEGLLALLSLRVDERLLNWGPRLRVVANFAVGYDNIDVAACSRRGIVVVNTPDVLTETTADLTWALLLAVARRIPEADRKVRSREWKGFAPDFMLGREVYGKTLGIVGLGRIGRAVARRALGFGMLILYTGRRPVPETPFEFVSLERLLTESDFVTLHCALGPTTRHLIGAEELARMKKGAALINTARGPLVDENALAEWVVYGGRAALDVFENEPNVHPLLLASENVVLAPHIGSATVETRDRMAELAAAGIDDVLAGRQPAHPVNPEVLGSLG